jgi:DNA excision repair protein ERCC-4
VLISPAEPKEFYALGTVSALPEKYGCDFLWVAQDRLCGAQRKTVADFCASTVDDRLAKELGQIKGLDGHAFLVVERRAEFVQGVLANVRGVEWSRAQWEGALLGVQERGVKVVWSHSTDDTKEILGVLEKWTAKAKHGSLSGRGGPVTTWGTPNNRDYQEWVLQGLPGVGPEMAKRILDHFGGIPLTWTCTETQLLAVDGIGPKRAQQLLSTFRKME